MARKNKDEDKKAKKGADEITVDELELDDSAPAAGAKGKKGKKEAAAEPTKEDKKKAAKAAEESSKAKADGNKKNATQKKSEVPTHLKVPDGYVTVGDLAEEYGTTERAVRTMLRDKFGKPADGGRWAWKKSDAQLKEIRGILGGKGKKEKEAPAETSKKDKGKEKVVDINEAKKGKEKDGGKKKK